MSNLGGGCTVGTLLSWLAPKYSALDATPPKWPPDLFAICATILVQSGGYRHVAQDWPPEVPKGSGKWANWIEKLGKEWQTGFTLGSLPGPVETWWRLLKERLQVEVREVGSDRDLCLALLQLCAVADSACSIVDVTPRQVKGAAQSMANDFQGVVSRTLDSRNGTTLCNPEIIDPFKARVLPRFRTPQRGLTMRSLTHNLALVRGNEVIPRWQWLPFDLTTSDPAMPPPNQSQVNLLLAPWPLTLPRRSFTEAPLGRGKIRNLAKEYKFFEFNPSVGDSREPIEEWLDSLFNKAKLEAGTIDLVVLPELALRPDEEVRVLEWAKKKRVAVIAGVGCSGVAETLGKNYVVFGLPADVDFLPLQQHKHHRWLLDRAQVEAYGLSGFLDPSYKWWEPIEIPERSLEFLTLRSNLTLCALVCEDLTQQEPVSELLRAIGPNLIIAVLMDGPQLGARWPARYAHVLADDPGSSVLTLTSLGMCERSQPFGMTPSRAIGMWRDGGSGKLRELILGPKADGMVISLLLEKRTEFTADGRSDGGTTTCPVFVGSCDVVLEKRKGARKILRRRARSSRRPV